MLECSCTLATKHGREFIHQTLRGYCLVDGIEKPVRAIEENYFEKAKNTIIEFEILQGKRTIPI
ncbi:DUF3870 domain-containing protein [Halobacillus shinanisalinarum]|uniref:DUF3870 domain-containing protein n=1 Tax=Halobacillus shinanisalinarum TaxID=2932258 RepID=UPI00272BF596|nr:DUF3870 domain-containing protein [Halobacillus shinanisalinarum]